MDRDDSYLDKGGQIQSHSWIGAIFSWIGVWKNLVTFLDKGDHTLRHGWTNLVRLLYKGLLEYFDVSIKINFFDIGWIL
jgi:hypothetical protein